MSSYVYTKLDETSDQIRLVTILPGVSSSHLVLDLHNTSFRPHEPVPYFEALSYTWGSSSDSPEIYIGKNSLRVTKTSKLHCDTSAMRTGLALCGLTPYV
jgi:hypothetical protein